MSHRNQREVNSGVHLLLQVLLLQGALESPGSYCKSTDSGPSRGSDSVGGPQHVPF